ncbi:hypothetical protein ADUPG1_012856, partial [Aduncisulcus paluster]
MLIHSNIEKRLFFVECQKDIDQTAARNMLEWFQAGNHKQIDVITPLSVILALLNTSEKDLYWFSVKDKKFVQNLRKYFVKSPDSDKKDVDKQLSYKDLFSFPQKITLQQLYQCVGIYLRAQASSKLRKQLIAKGVDEKYVYKKGLEIEQSTDDQPDKKGSKGKTDKKKDKNDDIDHIQMLESLLSARLALFSESPQESPESSKKGKKASIDSLATPTLNPIIPQAIRDDLSRPIPYDVILLCGFPSPFSPPMSDESILSPVEEEMLARFMHGQDPSGESGGKGGKGKKKEATPVETTDLPLFPPQSLLWDCPTMLIDCESTCDMSSESSKVFYSELRDIIQQSGLSIGGHFSITPDNDIPSSLPLVQSSPELLKVRDILGDELDPMYEVAEKRLKEEEKRQQEAKEREDKERLDRVREKANVDSSESTPSPLQEQASESKQHVTPLPTTGLVESAQPNSEDEEEEGDTPRSAEETVKPQFFPFGVAHSKFPLRAFFLSPLWSRTSNVFPLTVTDISQRSLLEENGSNFFMRKLTKEELEERQKEKGKLQKAKEKGKKKGADSDEPDPSSHVKEPLYVPISKMDKHLLLSMCLSTKLLDSLRKSIALPHVYRAWLDSGKISPDHPNSIVNLTPWGGNIIPEMPPSMNFTVEAWQEEETLEEQKARLEREEAEKLKMEADKGKKKGKPGDKGGKSTSFPESTDDIEGPLLFWKCCFGISTSSSLPSFSKDSSAVMLRESFPKASVRSVVPCSIPSLVQLDAVPPLRLQDSEEEKDGKEDRKDTGKGKDTSAFPNDLCPFNEWGGVLFEQLQKIGAEKEARQERIMLEDFICKFGGNKIPIPEDHTREKLDEAYAAARDTIFRSDGIDFVAVKKYLLSKGKLGRPSKWMKAQDRIEEEREILNQSAKGRRKGKKKAIELFEEDSDSAISDYSRARALESAVIEKVSIRWVNELVSIDQAMPVDVSIDGIVDHTDIETEWMDLFGEDIQELEAIHVDEEDDAEDEPSKKKPSGGAAKKGGKKDDNSALLEEIKEKRTKLDEQKSIFYADAQCDKNAFFLSDNAILSNTELYNATLMDIPESLCGIACVVHTLVDQVAANVSVLEYMNKEKQRRGRKQGMHPEIKNSVIISDKTDVFLSGSYLDKEEQNIDNGGKQEEDYSPYPMHIYVRELQSIVLKQAQEYILNVASPLCTLFDGFFEEVMKIGTLSMEKVATIFPNDPLKCFFHRIHLFCSIIEEEELRQNVQKRVLAVVMRSLCVTDYELKASSNEACSVSSNKTSKEQQLFELIPDYKLDSLDVSECILFMMLQKVAQEEGGHVLVHSHEGKEQADGDDSVCRSFELVPPSESPEKAVSLYVTPSDINSFSSSITQFFFGGRRTETHTSLTTEDVLLCEREAERRKLHQDREVELFKLWREWELKKMSMKKKPTSNASLSKKKKVKTLSSVVQDIEKHTPSLSYISRCLLPAPLDCENIQRNTFVNSPAPDSTPLSLPLPSPSSFESRSCVNFTEFCDSHAYFIALSMKEDKELLNQINGVGISKKVSRQSSQVPITDKDASPEAIEEDISVSLEKVCNQYAQKCPSVSRKIYLGFSAPVPREEHEEEEEEEVADGKHNKKSANSKDKPPKEHVVEDEHSVAPDASSPSSPEVSCILSIDLSLLPPAPPSTCYIDPVSLGHVVILPPQPPSLTYSKPALTLEEEKERDKRRRKLKKASKLRFEPILLPTKKKAKKKKEPSSYKSSDVSNCSFLLSMLPLSFCNSKFLSQLHRSLCPIDVVREWKKVETWMQMNESNVSVKSHISSISPGLNNMPYSSSVFSRFIVGSSLFSLLSVTRFPSFFLTPAHPPLPLNALAPLASKRRVTMMNGCIGRSGGASVVVTRRGGRSILASEPFPYFPSIIPSMVDDGVSYSIDMHREVINRRTLKLHPTVSNDTCDNLRETVTCNVNLSDGTCVRAITTDTTVTEKESSKISVLNGAMHSAVTYSSGCIVERKEFLDLPIVSEVMERNGIVPQTPWSLSYVCVSIPFYLPYAIFHDEHDQALNCSETLSRNQLMERLVRLCNLRSIVAGVEGLQLRESYGSDGSYHASLIGCDACSVPVESCNNEIHLLSMFTFPRFSYSISLYGNPRTCVIAESHRCVLDIEKIIGQQREQRRISKGEALKRVEEEEKKREEEEARLLAEEEKGNDGKKKGKPAPKKPDSKKKGDKDQKTPIETVNEEEMLLDSALEAVLTEWQQTQHQKIEMFIDDAEACIDPAKVIRVCSIDVNGMNNTFKVMGGEGFQSVIGELNDLGIQRKEAEEEKRQSKEQAKLQEEEASKKKKGGKETKKGGNNEAQDDEHLASVKEKMIESLPLVDTPSLLLKNLVESFPPLSRLVHSFQRVKLSSNEGDSDDSEDDILSFEFTPPLSLALSNKQGVCEFGEGSCCMYNLPEEERVRDMSDTHSDLTLHNVLTTHPRIFAVLGLGLSCGIDDASSHDRSKVYRVYIESGLGCGIAVTVQHGTVYLTVCGIECKECGDLQSNRLSLPLSQMRGDVYVCVDRGFVLCRPSGLTVTIAEVGGVRGKKMVKVDSDERSEEDNAHIDTPNGFVFVSTADRAVRAWGGDIKENSRQCVLLTEEVNDMPADTDEKIKKRKKERLDRLTDSIVTLLSCVPSLQKQLEHSMNLLRASISPVLKVEECNGDVRGVCSCILNPQASSGFSLHGYEGVDVKSEDGSKTRRRENIRMTLTGGVSGIPWDSADKIAERKNDLSFEGAPSGLYPALTVPLPLHSALSARVSKEGEVWRVQSSIATASWDLFSGEKGSGKGGVHGGLILLGEKEENELKEREAKEEENQKKLDEFRRKREESSERETLSGDVVISAGFFDKMERIEDNQLFDLCGHAGIWLGGRKYSALQSHLQYIMFSSASPSA